MKQKFSKEDLEKGKELVEKMTHKVTLDIYRKGCDPVNYHILKTLRDKKVMRMRELDLTDFSSRVPVARRVNDLAKSGMLKKEAGKVIKANTLGIHFVDVIEGFQKEVIKQLPKVML